MKGQHQIKIIQANEGGHVALSRKDGSYQVLRAFSAGDGAKLLEWVAKALGVELREPINLQGGLPTSCFNIDERGARAGVGDVIRPALSELQKQPSATTQPDRKPVRSREEKQRQFVAFIISCGGAAGWVRISFREIMTALQVTEQTGYKIASIAVDQGIIEKRIVKGDTPADLYRCYSEWRIAGSAEQAQPAEKESGQKATADEPKTVAAPPAPEVPPAAQAVKLETPAVEPIPPVTSVPTAPLERLPDGVDGDPGLDKRARMVLLCLRQIADRQGQQQFEVQLTRLAEKAAVPKPSMPSIIARLRTAHDVIIKEPLQRGWGWRFDLSKVARVAEAS